MNAEAESSHRSRQSSRVLSTITFLASLLSMTAAMADSDFTRTLVVDPSSSDADYASIGAAISALSAPSERWTILIYGGTYEEEVALDGASTANIDLIGVGGVTIVPDSGYPGITITGGTESARNNTIRNLRIVSSSAHGVEIVKGTGQVDHAPTSVTIEDVTIRTSGSGASGIYADLAVELALRRCDVQSEDTAVTLSEVTDATVEASWLRGGEVGLECDAGQGVLAASGWMIADSDLSVGGDAQGVRLVSASEQTTGDLLLHGVRAQGIRRHDDQDGIGAYFQTEGDPHALGCDLEGRGEVDVPDAGEAIDAYGVWVGGSGIDPSARITGGFVSAASKDTLGDGNAIGALIATGTLHVSGTPLPSWAGAISPGARRLTWRQRLVEVQAANQFHVVNVQAGLTTKYVTTGISDPDYPRTLTMVRTGSNLVGKTATVIGRDAHNARLRWSVTFVSGITIHTSPRPFWRVDAIAIPAVTAPGQKVRVGITADLALCCPLEAQTSVWQEARATSPIEPYVVETVGTVDLSNSTIDLSATLQDDDGYQHWLGASD